MDNHAVTPVVEKLLTIGLVVLFIGSMTTILFGSVVPDYRDAAGVELGERVLATAGEQVESAVPPRARHATGEVRVTLPSTIRGSAYRIEVRGRSLVLDHPNDAIGGQIPLSLPDRVSSVQGGWQSGATTLVRVRGDAGDLRIRLVEGSG